MKEKHWFLKSREYSISGLSNIINIFSTVGVEARSFLIILLIGNILDKYLAIFIQTFHLVPVYISAYMEQYSHHRHVISWGQFTIYTLPGRMEEEEGGGRIIYQCMWLIPLYSQYHVLTLYYVLHWTLWSLDTFLTKYFVIKTNQKCGDSKFQNRLSSPYEHWVFILDFFYCYVFLNRFQH